MIEVVGVLVAAADREHAGAEHVGKAVDDARRVASVREHPSKLGRQAKTPLGHREKHYAAVRGQAAAIEHGCDFLGVNSWKREWQNLSSVMAGVVHVSVRDRIGFATESYAVSAHLESDE
jgi:hypothetical protein